jgi:hypothetical protein
MILALRSANLAAILAVMYLRMNELKSSRIVITRNVHIIEGGT